MPTKSKKTPASSPSAPSPKAKASVSKTEKNRTRSEARSGYAFGSETHALQTVKWAVGLGLVPASVLSDATRAESKSELIEALERVREACKNFDYLEQGTRIAEMIERLRRAHE